MQKFLIEREIPKVGNMSRQELGSAARCSNKALAKLAPRVQWRNSYVTADKIFCVFLADSEEVIREHSKLSGFPASKITRIEAVIDPTTGN